MKDPKSRYRNYAPFGARAERGVKMGFHPALDKSGAMKRSITDAGPGSYDPKFQDCTYKNGINWARKFYIEEFSKFMGWKNLSLLQSRRFFETLNGPGSHDVEPALFHQQKDSVFEDAHFTKGRRFNYFDKAVIPSPDRYFYDLQKTSSMQPKGFTEVPTFEWDGFVDRFRTGKPPNYLLPPNLYEVTEHDGKGTADILKKRVSIRGPYDLFTGLRDESTLKGFYGPSTTKLPDWFFVPPSSVDVFLKHPNFARHGKFFKEDRLPKIPTKRHMLNDLALCYRDPNDPGPATYDMTKFKGIVVLPRGLYPFDTCKLQARPHPGRVSIFPGAGRYNIKNPKYMKQKKVTYVFASKYPRINIYRDYNYRSF